MTSGRTTPMLMTSKCKVSRLRYRSSGRSSREPDRRHYPSEQSVPSTQRCYVTRKNKKEKQLSSHLPRQDTSPSHLSVPRNAACHPRFLQSCAKKRPGNIMADQATTHLLHRRRHEQSAPTSIHSSTSVMTSANSRDPSACCRRKLVRLQRTALTSQMVVRPSCLLPILLQLRLVYSLPL